MFDLKVLKSVLEQLEQERGIPRKKMIEAIESALATAYKKDYGKRGQIVRAHFDCDTGIATFEQVKIIIDRSHIVMPEERRKKTQISELTEDLETERQETSKESLIESDSNKINESQEDTSEQNDERINFNPEQHILLEDALKIKNNISTGEEIVFPLEPHDEYGRIAAQTAKQVIIQKIREAERESVMSEFSSKQGEIVSGIVQRTEQGAIFVDLGRAVGVLSSEEQIHGEHYRPGERIRAYLCSVEESHKGVFLRLSRSHPKFLAKLFEIESPEIGNGVVEIKAITREPGSRSKIAVFSHDQHIDPVGSLVGQRGVRVSTVTSELGGEKIDIIAWSQDPEKFVADAISPAKALSVHIDEANHKASIDVLAEHQSLAIGKGGQNARLAAKLTGWKIDIRPLLSAGEQTPNSAIQTQENANETPEQ